MLCLSRERCKKSIMLKVKGCIYVLTVPRKVLEWVIRKKGIPKVLVRSVMSLHEGAKTMVRVDSELSEEFEVKVGMHQGFVLSPFLFTVVVDVVELNCH